MRMMCLVSGNNLEKTRIEESMSSELVLKVKRIGQLILKRNWLRILCIREKQSCLKNRLKQRDKVEFRNGLDGSSGKWLGL